MSLSLLENINFKANVIIMYDKIETETKAFDTDFSEFRTNLFKMVDDFSFYQDTYKARFEMWCIFKSKFTLENLKIYSQLDCTFIPLADEELVRGLELITFYGENFENFCSMFETNLEAFMGQYFTIIKRLPRLDKWTFEKEFQQTHSITTLSYGTDTFMVELKDPTEFITVELPTPLEAFHHFGERRVINVFKKRVYSRQEDSTFFTPFSGDVLNGRVVLDEDLITLDDTLTKYFVTIDCEGDIHDITMRLPRVESINTEDLIKYNLAHKYTVGTKMKAYQEFTPKPRFNRVPLKDDSTIRVEHYVTTMHDVSLRNAKHLTHYDNYVYLPDIYNVVD